MGNVRELSENRYNLLLKLFVTNTAFTYIARVYWAY